MTLTKERLSFPYVCITRTHLEPSFSLLSVQCAAPATQKPTLWMLSNWRVFCYKSSVQALEQKAFFKQEKSDYGTAPLSNPRARGGPCSHQSLHQARAGLALSPPQSRAHLTVQSPLPSPMSDLEPRKAEDSTVWWEMGIIKLGKLWCEHPEPHLRFWVEAAQVQGSDWQH